jgi:hypothetical protein
MVEVEGRRMEMRRLDSNRLGNYQPPLSVYFRLIAE